MAWSVQCRQLVQTVKTNPAASLYPLKAGRFYLSRNHSFQPQRHTDEHGKRMWKRPIPFRQDRALMGEPLFRFPKCLRSCAHLVHRRSRSVSTAWFRLRAGLKITKNTILKTKARGRANHKTKRPGWENVRAAGDFQTRSNRRET